MGKNKKQKMGNTNANQTEFAADNAANANVANKAAQKNANQSNR